MPWAALKKMMTDKYCPRGEIKKIETEMWNLKKEIDEGVKKYIGGLPDMILGIVKQKGKERMMIFPRTIKTNRIRGRTQARPTLQATVKGNHTPGLSLYVPSVIVIMKQVLVHLGVITAIGLAIWPGTGNGCFECGDQGHFKRNCPRLRNNDRGNQAGNDRAPAKVYVVGNAGANPDNVVAGTFLLNNRYAYILFDNGSDRKFLCPTSFSSQIDITPSTLDHYYDVELADGRIIGLNTILKGCTLNFLNHQFNINLMPVELGSFDAIIAINIISCTKTQKYMERGFPIFLAHVTTKEVEDKSEKKRLEERYHSSKTFLNTAPYRLAALLDERVSEQLKEQSDKKGFIRPVPHLGELHSCFGPRRKTDHFQFPRSSEHRLVKEIHVDLAKTKSIRIDTPKSPTEISQFFLGLAGYYRRFIEGFSKIAKPMTKLTQKKVKFEWGDKQEAAFQLLKQKLCSAPILALPEGSKIHRDSDA
ncbi:putative reverse transcriptase domain-containing protein [Tanacetum coccineum]